MYVCVCVRVCENNGERRRTGFANEAYVCKSEGTTLLSYMYESCLLAKASGEFHMCASVIGE